ncbi:hypothetical protein CCR75_008412 [Bremia lactucae]|uniref:Uncharacterized protein n=1 Tax=Bremia lactucae TaxID=4779 RepID=A0A976NZW9_BRELC|nr:hypothetical protein CCR75_008412 [Bremia lactucae]
MEQGLLSSSSKQRAFVQLISSEPSLLNRLDDNFIKSIISLSPAKKRDDMRLDQLTRGYKDGNNRKKSLRLYLENELCGDNQPQLVSPKHLCKAKTVSSMNADAVLLSPSSTATALAAAAQSFQNGWTNQSDVSSKAHKTCGNPIHGFQLDMKLQQDHVRRVDVKRKILRKFDSPRDNSISTGAYESNQHQIGNTCLASMPRSCDSVNYTIDCNESVDAVNSTKSSTFNGTSLTSYTMLDNLRYDSPDSRRTKDLKNRINQSNGDSENCESSNNL